MRWLVLIWLTAFVGQSQAFSQSEGGFSKDRLEFGIYVGKPSVKIRNLEHFIPTYPRTEEFARNRQLFGEAFGGQGGGISARYILNGPWAAETGLRFVNSRYRYRATREIPGYFMIHTIIQDEISSLELPIHVQYALHYRLFNKVRSIRFAAGPSITHRIYGANSSLGIVEHLGPAPSTSFHLSKGHREARADQFTFGLDAEIKLAPLVGKRWDLTLLYHHNHLFNRSAEGYAYKQIFTYINHPDGLMVEEEGAAFFGMKTSYYMLQLGYAIYRPPLTMKEKTVPIRTPRYEQ